MFGSISTTRLRLRCYHQGILTCVGALEWLRGESTWIKLNDPATGHDTMGHGKTKGNADIDNPKLKKKKRRTITYKIIMTTIIYQFIRMVEDGRLRGIMKNY